jgi:hypothetical protein
MLTQFFYSMRTSRHKLATSGRNTRRQYRGLFEHLENRAMLSATMGPTAPVIEQTIETITDVFVITPASPELVAPELVAPPIAGPHDVLPTDRSYGDGDGLWLPPGDGQPQKAMSPEHPPDVVRSTVTVSLTLAGTKFDVSAVNSTGNSSKLHFTATQIPDGELPGIEHLLAELGAHETLPPAGDAFVLHLIGTDTPKGILSNHNYDGTQGGNVHGPSDGQIGEGGLDRLMYDQIELGHNGLPPIIGNYTESPTPSTLVGQSTSAEAISQRAYDAVLQSYLPQPAMLSSDQIASNQLNSFSLAGVRSSVDDCQGGFAELDGSDAVGRTTTSRSPADGSNDAIDAVLTELYDFDASAKGESGNDGIDQSSADIAASDPATSYHEAATLIGGADQGGMIVLRSAEKGRDLVAAAADQPVDLSVPDANMHMEAAVGIYQAFDVATGEQALTGKMIPAAAVVPAQKPEQSAKGNVSADKVAKPSMDQASAWVEIVTAAAVIGASKKERKARTKS